MLAVGKASIAMAEAAIGVLGAQVGRALVVSHAGNGEEPAAAAADGGVPVLASGSLRGVEFRKADHPVPSTRNVLAAARVREFASMATVDETLVVLLSGGTSAMLCLPREGVCLDDIAGVTDVLLRNGAPIEELNAVRKHCEVLKGGGLAATAAAGRVRALVLSDVLGDRLDVIGSGPTAPDPTTFAEALEVLRRRDALAVATAATALLQRGCEGEEPETIKPADKLWERVENHVIGDNGLAVDAAAESCVRAGYSMADRREGVQGEAATVGRDLAIAARRLVAHGVQANTAIVWGGETTVTVGDASGIGGRNQELALAAAVELAEGGRACTSPAGTPRVTILSLATDGRDGPTDAAGAVVDEGTCARIRGAGIDPAGAMRRHDSHTALDAADALIRTGPTGTNVNDVMLALIES